MVESSFITQTTEPLLNKQVLPFAHMPVLLPQLLALARLAAPRLIVDCTVGGAGHAQALLEAFPQAMLFGIDRDIDAVRTAGQRLAVFGARAVVVHGAFSSVATLLQQHIPAQAHEVDILLADFGVSSYQLDTADRGFSFRYDVPLDMRMDQSCGKPAWQMLEEMDATSIAQMIFYLGEERYSRPIARAIVRDKPRSTGALATLVRAIVPKKPQQRTDVATRTFQAIRMFVNQELEEIHAFLEAIPNVLAPMGVALCIAFHSLEDRLVKQTFRTMSQGCTCPSIFPVCVCGKQPLFKVLTAKAVVADMADINSNPRARSARLRGIQRLSNERLV